MPRPHVSGEITSEKTITQMKWNKLRLFLLTESLKGSSVAFKLLKDMPAHRGGASA
jgi:hypothetical protein